MKFSDLDTPSGHICVGLVLMFVGASFVHFNIPKSDDIIVAGLTTVGIAMKNQLSQKN